MESEASLPDFFWLCFEVRLDFVLRDLPAVFGYLGSSKL